MACFVSWADVCEQKNQGIVIVKLPYPVHAIRVLLLECKAPFRVPAKYKKCVGGIQCSEVTDQLQHRVDGLFLAN